MLLKATSFIIFVFVYAFAFDDNWVNGDTPKDMVENGKAQYQLLKERGSLPKYGACWRSAVEAVDDTCRHLTEETQSDVALHLTNCFLEQAGHDTIYHCAGERKPNVRAICLSSMSDRAFNVYTEFYTHAYHMCWFLRGQIWHETISENAYKMSKQLENSAHVQHQLLDVQRESVRVQNEILTHGRQLESVLSELYTATATHKEILTLLTTTLNGFQQWALGQVAWIDSALFYALSTLCVFLFTCFERTKNARGFLFTVLIANYLTERFITTLLINYNGVNNSVETQERIYKLTWICRYFFTGLALCVLFYSGFYHANILVENQRLLKEIHKQNTKILDALNEGVVIKNKAANNNRFKLDLINEISPNNNNKQGVLSSTTKYSKNDFGTTQRLENLCKLNGRYNLRSKNTTPEPK